MLLVMVENSLESVNSTVLELRREVEEMHRDFLESEDAIGTRSLKILPKVVGMPCDVSKSEDVRALSDAAVREFGNINIWVGTPFEAVFHIKAYMFFVH